MNFEILSAVYWNRIGWLFVYLFIDVELRGVVEDLSGLRGRGPGFKTRSRPLTFMKAVTEFQNPTRCGVLMH
jgi:hypothetical protein